MKEVAPEAPVVPVSENSFNLNFLLNNNMYIAYIVLILVVLIAIGIYLYRKYFVKIKTTEKLENTEKKEKVKQILDPTKEYYLKDGTKEILLNSFFDDIIINKQVNKDELIQKLQNEFQQLQADKQQVHQMQQQLTQQAQMMQLQAQQSQQTQQPQQTHHSQVLQQSQQMQQPQQMQQTHQMQQTQAHVLQQPSEKKQRPKLSHPKDKADNLGLSEIEDENIAALNLTNEELAELKKQILALKKSQNKQISAQNDDDDEDDDSDSE